MPPQPADLLERVAQYQNVRGATAANRNREGKGLFISTRFTGVPQLHYVAMPGGARQQVTFYREPLTETAVAPDKKQHGLVFSRDNGGDESYQLYYHDLDTARYSVTARRST